jgi:hypothetical protein
MDDTTVISKKSGQRATECLRGRRIDGVGDVC